MAAYTIQVLPILDYFVFLCSGELEEFLSDENSFKMGIYDPEEVQKWVEANRN